MRVVLEFKVASLAMKVDLAQEEAESIEPREQDPRDNLTDTLFTETQVITADDRGVDKEHPVRKSMNRLTE